MTHYLRNLVQRAKGAASVSVGRNAPVPVVSARPLPLFSLPLPTPTALSAVTIPQAPPAVSAPTRAAPPNPSPSFTAPDAAPPLSAGSSESASPIDVVPRALPSPPLRSVSAPTQTEIPPALPTSVLDERLSAPQPMILPAAPVINPVPGVRAAAEPPPVAPVVEERVTVIAAQTITPPVIESGSEQPQEAARQHVRQPSSEVSPSPRQVTRTRPLPVIESRRVETPLVAAPRIEVHDDGTRRVSADAHALEAPGVVSRGIDTAVEMRIAEAPAVSPPAETQNDQPPALVATTAPTVTPRALVEARAMPVSAPRSVPTVTPRAPVEARAVPVSAPRSARRNVEVHIGSLEVRFAEPETPHPMPPQAAPPRPNFDDYAARRSYREDEP